MKKLVSLFIIAVMLLSAFTVTVGAEATVSITKSSSEVLVGKTVKVTFTFKDADVIGGVNALISFDNTKLSYVNTENSLGSGQATLQGKTVKVLFYNAASTSKTATVTVEFKTLAVGEAEVSVNTIEITDVDGVALGAPSGTSKVTVKMENKSKNANLKWLTVPKGCTLVPAFSKDVTEYTCTVPGSVTSFPMDWAKEDPKATDKVSGDVKLKVGENTRSVTVTAEDGTKKVYTVKITRLKPENTPTPSATPTPTLSPSPTITAPPVSVIIDGETYTVQSEINLTVPEGYKTEKYTYNSTEIQTAVLGGVRLIQLNNGTRDVLFKFDEKTHSFTEFKVIASTDTPLTVLDEKPELAEGNGIHKVIGEGEYTVWECSLLGDGYYLIKVMNGLGEGYTAIYCESDQSVQRLSSKLYERLASGGAVILTPVPQGDVAGKPLDWTLIALIAGGVILIALIVLIIVLLARGGKKPKKAKNDRDWGFNDPYDISIDDDLQSEKPKKMKKIEDDDFT